MRRRGVVSFGPVSLSPPPGGFLQASLEGEAALVAAALTGIGDATDIADLFAGSGALGLEALSRGALQVDFVDASATVS